MKPLRISLMVGFFAGLAICVCLVILHGMSMRGTVGLRTSYFLGCP